MVQRSLIALVLVLFSFQNIAKSEIIFEAYYKIFLAEMPVGYSIERYEFDKKKSEFIATTYVKIKTPEKDTSESIKARSDKKLTPLGYEYTLASIDPKTQDKGYKNIKATIKNNVLKAKVLDGKKEYDVTKSLVKGTYLSVFLPFAILNSKEGLKLEKHYSYKAISEESAEVHAGEAYIKAKEDYESIPAFKILNRYDKDQFVSIMTSSGDVLEVRMPTSQLKMKIVATQAEAVDQFQFSASNMALLFGSVPTGKDNALSKKLASAGAKSLEEVLGKDSGEAKSEKKKSQNTKKAGAPPVEESKADLAGKDTMVKSKLPAPAEKPEAAPLIEEKNQ